MERDSRTTFFPQYVIVCEWQIGLVDALAEPFDPSKYHDRYREALLELIASKTEGRAVMVPEAEAPAPMGDLMAALRASVEAARKRAGGGASGKPRADAEGAAPPARTTSAAADKQAARASKAAGDAAADAAAGQRDGDKPARTSRSRKKAA